MSLRSTPHLSTTINTYSAIRERILAFEPTLDEETLTDTLEGLTDLHEVIAAIVRSALTSEALAEGLKVHIARLQDRHQRFLRRADACRQIARDAMLEADLKTLRAPDFTLSVKMGNPGLVLTNERAIPSEYWRPQEPRLDRKGLLSDLKRGLDVEGAMLSNPEPVLSVRIR